MSVKHFFPDLQAIRRFLPRLLGLVLVATACGTESGAAAGTPPGGERCIVVSLILGFAAVLGIHF